MRRLRVTLSRALTVMHSRKLMEVTTEKKKTKFKCSCPRNTFIRERLKEHFTLK